MNKATIRKFNKDLGSRLKKLRRNAGVTQEKIAKEADCTTTYISCLERGECKVPVYILMVYSRILDISPNKLLDHEKNDEAIRETVKMLSDCTELLKELTEKQ